MGAWASHLSPLGGVELGGLWAQAGPSQPLCLPQILALRQARRPVPPEVAQQYQDIMQRSQWQRTQLEQGGPGMRRGRAPGRPSGEGGLAPGPSDPCLPSSPPPPHRVRGPAGAAAAVLHGGRPAPGQRRQQSEPGEGRVRAGRAFGGQAARAAH